MQQKETIKIISTNSSPSHLQNNFTHNKTNFYFIHNSESNPRVISIDKTYLTNQSNIGSLIKSFNNSETNEMIFVKSVVINNTNYIAIGLYGGFKLWSLDGNRLLYQIPTKNQKPNRPYAFTSICEFQAEASSNGNDSLLCGDNYGQLFMVFGHGSNWKSKLINKEPNGITSVSNYKGSKYICVTYDNNNNVLYKLENGECKEIKKFKEENLSMVSACVKDKNGKYYCGCGMINGEIKVYGFDSLICEVSISSHLRGINALIGVNDCLVGGSDDGCVNIWRIGGKVEVVHNIQIEDKMIVGICYDDEKKVLYVSAYDCPEIIMVENVNL